MTKDELVTKNAELEAEVEALRVQIHSLREQLAFYNQRHEVAAMLLGDAVINNRVMAEMQAPSPSPRPHVHDTPTLSPVEAKELGLA